MTTSQIEFAQKLADFVKYNNIDLSTVSFEEVIEGYKKAQDKMYSKIKKDLRKEFIGA